MTQTHTLLRPLPAGSTMLEVRKARIAKGVVPSMKRVDTCAAEFEAGTPYMYSTYEGECECDADNNKKVRGRKGVKSEGYIWRAFLESH